MWGFLIGLYLAIIIYPLLEEWRQRQSDKRRLTKMREHHARGRRWDSTKGQSIDE
jgi:predicted PurR-regulated permease PerM